MATMVPDIDFSFKSPATQEAHRPMIPVGNVMGVTIFAKRTEAGGIAFFSDDVGGGQLVVDFTTVDATILKLCIDLHSWVDQEYEDMAKIYTNNPSRFNKHMGL